MFDQMPWSGFTRELIFMTQGHAEGGTPVAYTCRKLETAKGTYHRRQKQLGWLAGPDLQEKNRKLKQRAPDLSVEKGILLGVDAKKHSVPTPA